LNESQIGEIKAAIEEADEGDFASGQAVEKTLGNWGVDAG
jgi:predicted transcriptional regulator